MTCTKWITPPRRLALAICAVAAMRGPLDAAEPMSTAEIVVDCRAEHGPVKPMNAVNNGPSVKTPAGDQKRGNFDDYTAARIPFARTHDSNLCTDYGAPHTVDISAVFPDFDADETDPASYDFVCTDRYLDSIRRAGTEVFFRLGQSIEHGPKKYGALPPVDFAKWARIAEHVIRHYNEGWGWGADDIIATASTAWSNQFSIAYWELGTSLTWTRPTINRRGTRAAGVARSRISSNSTPSPPSTSRRGSRRSKSAGPRFAGAKPGPSASSPTAGTTTSLSTSFRGTSTPPTLARWLKRPGVSARCWTTPDTGRRNRS